MSKNFIDFIIEARDNEEYYREFLAREEPEKLKAFFDRHNFEVSLEDCEKLSQAKERFGISADRVPPAY